MSYSYVTMVRDGSEPTYKFAEVKYGKIVAINEHWVPLEEYRKFFEANALFIDITGVKIDGEEPQVGDAVSSNGEITHIKAVYSPAEYRAFVVEKMKLIRDQKELDPIEYKVGDTTYTFDADADANVRISKARQMLEDTGLESITWTTWDNQHVELTVNDFKGINVAQAERSNALHVRYNQLKTYIYGVEDVSALNNLTWDSEI